MTRNFKYRSRRSRAASWLVLLAFAGLTACAYHAGDSRGPGKELKIFLPVVENRTARAFDLNLITGQFRELLEGIKAVRIVNSAAESDFVILGKITEFDKGWGPSAFKGTDQTQAQGGLRTDFLSAQSVSVSINMEITKVLPNKEKVWTSNFQELDFYQLTDRLELARGSAEAPQLNASREGLLVLKLADRIFRRARAQIVDDF